MSKRTLIVLAHPYMQDSRVNKALITAITNNQNITIHNLCDKYPDFNINIETEHKLLLDHDNIIIQFPIFWYNMPAILKHWFDVTFTRGFSHFGAKKLEGKVMQIVATAGASTEQYIPSIWLENQKNNPTDLDYQPNMLKPILAKKYDKDIFNTFFSPIEQTAHYVAMVWKNPFIITAALPENSAPYAISNEQIAIKTKEYIELINKLNNA